MVPVVTSNTASLATNATTITINGYGFDPTAAHNTVVLSSGAIGTVTTASATSLTVTFSTRPAALGTLIAVVTTDSQSSGTAVQVAKVIPVVTSNTTHLAANAATVTINGFGFDSVASHNTVVLSDGAVGTVTAASSTSLTVTLNTKPTTAGTLTAVVTTDSQSNGTAVQIATVAWAGGSARRSSFRARIGMSLGSSGRRKKGITVPAKAWNSSGWSSLQRLSPTDCPPPTQGNPNPTFKQLSKLCTSVGERLPST